MSIRGSCLCGAVQYEVTQPLQLVGNCHCSRCRKANGAAYVTWGILAPDSFRWTSGEEFVESYASSPETARCFCRQCGSSLASSHAGVVGEVVLGSVDGDPGAVPGSHIFVASKASWHEITDTLPQYPGWPPGFAS